MSDDAFDRARRFATGCGLVLCDELGAGTQGVVFSVRDKRGCDWSALKIHFRAESFRREWEIHQRLSEFDVFEVAGFAVPRLERVDAALFAIEMSIVRPPYVLDFAGAVLDEEPPEFPEDTLRLWEQEKREQFGERWPTVLHVIAGFARFGIHLLDITPGNIAFRP